MTKQKQMTDGELRAAQWRRAMTIRDLPYWELR